MSVNTGKNNNNKTTKNRSEQETEERRRRQRERETDGSTENIHSASQHVLALTKLFVN